MSQLRSCKEADECAPTQCDLWNSPIPTASPKHRPGNIAAPVYPTCIVAVSEALQRKGGLISVIGKE